MKCPYGNDTPLARDLWYEDHDEYNERLRAVYGKAREVYEETLRSEINEWVKEMKHDKGMSYVFQKKAKEVEGELRMFRGYMDRRMRLHASEGLMGEILVQISRDLKHKESILEAKCKRWRYLYDMSRGKMEEKKDDIDFDQLKEDVRIESLLGVNPKTRGRTQIKCPIHNENTPSFVVYHENNSFYCFGCGVGGSVIDFIIHRDGVSIKEAVNLLTGM